MQEVRLRRRPTRSNTALVKAALDALQAAAVDWAPRFVGLEANEEVLSWLPGEPLDTWVHERDRLGALAAIVRQLHDLTAPLANEGACLLHDDLQPRNVVVDGDFIGLIDWEQLRPGRRVEDVAQLCWSFVGPSADDTVDTVVQRWRDVLDAYGLENRDEVVDAAIVKIQRCVADIVGQAERGSVRHQALHRRGDHHDLEATLGWLTRHRDALTSALG